MHPPIPYIPFIKPINHQCSIWVILTSLKIIFSNLHVLNFSLYEKECFQKKLLPIKSHSIFMICQFPFGRTKYRTVRPAVLLFGLHWEASSRDPTPTFPNTEAASQLHVALKTLHAAIQVQYWTSSSVMTNQMSHISHGQTRLYGAVKTVWVLQKENKKNKKHVVYFKRTTW